MTDRPVHSLRRSPAGTGGVGRLYWPACGLVAFGLLGCGPPSVAPPTGPLAGAAGAPPGAIATVPPVFEPPPEEAVGGVRIVRDFGTPAWLAADDAEQAVFVPDGRVVVATSGRMRRPALSVWRRDGVRLRDALVPRRIVALALDGGAIAAFDGEAITRYDLDSLEATRTRSLPAAKETAVVGFAPGSRVVVFESEAPVRRFGLEPGDDRTLGPAPAFEVFALSADAARYAVAMYPIYLRQGDPPLRVTVHETATARVLASLDLSRPASALCFSADGERLGIVQGLRVSVLELGTQSLRVVRANGPPELRPMGRMDRASCAFSDDGRKLATGGYEGWIELFDLATSVTKGPVPRASVGSRPISRLALSPDGALLFAATDGPMVDLLELEKLTPLAPRSPCRPTQSAWPRWMRPALP